MNMKMSAKWQPFSVSLNMSLSYFAAQKKTIEISIKI